MILLIDADRSIEQGPIVGLRLVEVVDVVVAVVVPYSDMPRIMRRTIDSSAIR